jgi:4,5-dihydroxyphthalate decarboxylase
MAMSLKITLACERYDRVSALFDGRVRIEGCDVTFVPLKAEETFHRAFNGADFDVTEISSSTYMMTLSRGESPYIAVPAMVSKVFRHSAFFVRKDRGIRVPQDLVGKKIGLPEYQMTACLWGRGIIQDEYGVQPKDIKWFTGGLEQPGRHERARLTVDPAVSITPIPTDQTLNQMLSDGEIDGLLTGRNPSCFGKNPQIVHLFENFREVEAEYFRKTKIFPIMHMVAIRKTLLETNPWLGVSIYKAFLQAKELAVADLFEAGLNFVTLPWVYDELNKARAMMATNDYWSYGVEANRAAIEAMARYSYTQGLSQRHLKVEELFAPGTLDMSKL